MAMIDFHTHILPEIDDGSRNIETSAAMYNRCIEQGIEVILATPHFYAEKDSIDHFLDRRERAMERMRMNGLWGPEILTGAEVAWFEGISRAKRINSLTIGNTDVLLLELPFSTWNERLLDELTEMTKNFQIVLAHLERYFKIPGNKKVIENIVELPLHVQINAGSLTDWRKRGAILKMFKNGQAHLLGSDCHGMNHRPPNLTEGRSVIEKKLGSCYLSKIDAEGMQLLGV